MDQLMKDVTLTKEQRLELEHIRLQADSYTADQLDELFAKYGVTALATGNPLTHPFPFNLMFSTQIGPEGTLQGFLRPETAQGMFMNYRRLLDYNGRKFPFAAAQVGTGFRNEISPRAGLLRVREFPMAEIEHFCNPNDKRHPKFAKVSHLVLPLFSREHQQGDGKLLNITRGDAEGLRRSEGGGGAGRHQQRDAGVLHGAHVPVPAACGHRAREAALPPAPADGDGALRVGLLGRRGEAVVRLDGVSGHR